MTSINVKSLADFRRFLALPGASIQVVRHDWIEAKKPGWTPDRVAAVLAPRTVKKLQTNAVKFSNDSWLYWDTTWGGRGAKSFHFAGETFSLDLTKDGSFREIVIYRLAIAA